MPALFNSQTQSILLKVFGYAGFITSVGLNLSPVPVFREVIQKGDVEYFSAFVYMASFCECFLWSFYAIVQPDMVESLINTSVGACLQLVYLCLFFRYSKGSVRKDFCKKVIVGSVLLAVVVVCTLFVAPKLGFLDILGHQGRSSNFIGCICAMLTLIMYISPLTVLGHVIKTRSSHYLPFWITVSTVISASMWVGYGIALDDYFFVVPNVLGTLLGTLGIVLYFVFRNPNDLPGASAAKNSRDAEAMQTATKVNAHATPLHTPLAEPLLHTLPGNGSKDRARLLAHTDSS
eukprot:c21526_g1_i1.p1 GENE.c21526_g1_i1~~c21526_g1_i1.p1  ORF type:complete len:291 (+),score=75.25 c21526_g1_i1:55-927(+)